MTSTLVTDPQYYYFEFNDTTTMDSPSCDEICIFYAVANVIICVLGVAGNGLVIWIAGFKVKSVISTWYLSLAVSDFLFCTFLPFEIVHVVRGSWMFGSFMCKFTAFIRLLNWYSSIFLLVIISVDRCVVVMFPVWTQNQRAIRKASVIVILAWIISAMFYILTFFKDISMKFEKNQCSYTSYMHYFSVVVYRFIFLFVIPFLLIIICYVLIIQKLNTNQMARSKKPFKIMTALIVSFLICWLPYHTVALIMITKEYSRSLYTTSAFSSVLANANSCLNPFLYAFMGKDFKKECSALLSKIESAVVEEQGHGVVQQTTITISEENFQ